MEGRLSLIATPLWFPKALKIWAIYNLITTRVWVRLPSCWCKMQTSLVTQTKGRAAVQRTCGAILPLCLFFFFFTRRWGVVLRSNTSLIESANGGFGISAFPYCNPRASRQRDKRDSRSSWTGWMTRLNGREQQTRRSGMAPSPLHCLLCAPLLLVSPTPIIMKGPRTIRIYSACRKQGRRHTMQPCRLFDSSLMTALNRYRFRQLWASCVVKRHPVLIRGQFEFVGF